MSALDDTDRRLLRVLQADGRITNAELAKRCNLSPAATFDRVRRLRERGFITGYAALLDPAKVDRALLIFVEVVLDRTTGDVFDEFGAAVRRAPEILECHMVAGGFDYLIKARCATWRPIATSWATSWSRCPACARRGPMRCWKR